MMPDMQNKWLHLIYGYEEQNDDVHCLHLAVNSFLKFQSIGLAVADPDMNLLNDLISNDCTGSI